MRLDNFIRKIFGPKNIPSAINAINSRLLSSVGKVEDRYLIEEIAKTTGEDTNALLFKVSQKLGLLPSADTPKLCLKSIELSGIKEEELIAAKAAIVKSSSESAKYCLVVSDPSLIEVSEFKKNGIPVALGLGSNIDKAWEEQKTHSNDFRDQSFLNNQKESTEEVKKLFKLCGECEKLKATNLVLGKPNIDQYSFLYKNISYSAKLPNSLLNSLLLIMGENKYVELESDIIGKQEQSSNITLVKLERLRGKEINVKWSTVQDELELDPADHEYKAVQSSAENISYINTEDKQSGGKKILVVDDDVRFRKLLNKIFSVEGWEVTIAENVDLALKKLNAFTPDIVVCDLHMPDKKGTDFLSEYRKINTKTPVIILTSDDSTQSEIDVASLGASALVNKNSDPQVLFAWCNNLLKHNAYIH